MTDLDTLCERIRTLAHSAPDERRETLAMADSLLDAEAVWILDELFDPGRDGPMEASSFERRLRRNGYSHKDVIMLLAAAAEAHDTQAEWSQSPDVDRRDETILKLQTLAETSLLADDLVPFLMHQLRSPDPSIYQVAAVAVGRHLPDNTRLFDAVQQYAATRNLDLATPASLDGNRTRRRVFLVQAAAQGTDWEDENRPPSPLQSGHPIEYDSGTDLPLLPADQEDRAVLLLTSRLLLGAPDPDGVATGVAEQLVSLVPDEPLDRVSPILLQRWGELLDTLVNREVISPVSAAEEWGRLLVSIESALTETESSQPFSETAHALFLLDEHAHTLAAMPDSVGSTAASHRTSLPESLGTLLARRVLFWRRRTAGRPPPEGWPQAVPDPPADASPGLTDILRSQPAAAGTAVGSVSPVDVDLALVETLLGILTSESRWQARSTGDRALSVVFLLITIQNLAGEHDRVIALLRTRGIPVPPGDEARSRALAAVLLRVFQFEDASSVGFLDSRILDSISDVGVLLTLLPTDEPPLLAANLADDFEYEIRRTLRTETRFRPLQLLVLSTVRDPHPAFYDALQEIVEGRTYADENGREVPIETTVDAIHQETASGRSTDDDPWSDPTVSGADPILKARSRIRDRLGAVNAANKSLLESLEELLEVLGVPEGPRDTPGNNTLLGVIQLVHSASDRMLMGGPTPWRDETPQSFVDRHSETVSSIRGRIDSLQLTRLEEARDVSDDLEAVLEDLEEVVAELVRVLPDVEAARLTEVFDEFDRRIDAYTQGLEIIIATWRSLDPPPSPDRWNALVDEVTERWDVPDRPPILHATFQSLESAFVNEAGTDSWAAKRAFLGWATTAHDGRPWSQEAVDTWEQTTAELWAQLLEEAMDAGQESRVRDLLRTTSFERLLGWPSSAKALGRAHEWALDRYMVGVARHVRSLRGESANTSMLGEYLRESRVFFVHHSSMWIAIAVGAILMQDFGDAWKAMAEQGDVQGIAITFVLATGAAFSYVMFTLHRKTAPSPGENQWTVQRSHVTRVTAFVGLCLAVALTVTTFLWWLLSGTDQVVHGPGAILHIIVWLSFAVLIGIFLGFVAKEEAV